MAGLPAQDFVKMHGLGNDFVIVDARAAARAPGRDAIRLIADRRKGVGCDQLILLEQAADADLGMRIFNADGGEAGACGNATRCVVRLLVEREGFERVRIRTAAGILEGWADKDGFAVDMGPARLDWAEIPLASPADTLALDIAEGPLERPVAVSMGNPHMVFFVADPEAVPLEALGPGLERHAMFPERVNVGVAGVMGRERLRLRVFERGAGITPACGSGACAAVVAGVRRGLLERKATVVVDGGELTIHWRERDGHVLMRGPANLSFTGTLAPELFEEEPPA